MTNFDEAVYEVLRKVPRGSVTTYKNIANALNTKAYRRVGTSLKNNPYAPEVPCHRVVKNDGSIGGFMGHISGSTITKKIELLKSEGVEVINGKVVDFGKICWRG